MKTVGFMVSLAIAFVVMTSPDKVRSKAETEPLPLPSSSAVEVQAEWRDVDPVLLAAIERFDARLENIDQLLDQHSTELSSIEQCHTDALSSIDARLKVLESNLTSIVEVRGATERTPVKTAAGAVAKTVAGAGVVAAKTAKGAAIVAGKTAVGVAKVAAVPFKVAGNYTPRWRNYDGRSLRDHGVEVHGFDPSWSTAQIAAAHDAWHDANGGEPPTASRSRSVAVSSSSTCPGGVCPTTTSRTRAVASRGGLFGFGLLGRRR